MTELFREGGPHQIRRTGQDQYEMKVQIGAGEDGYTARECPESACSPGYFRVKGGTGRVGPDYTSAFCPYCRKEADPNKFATRAQVEYARSLLKREAIQGIERMTRDALGLDSRGRRKIGSGLFSIDLTMKGPPNAPVPHPLEEELRRDLRCPNCTLDHAVFGLGIWCPDCGMDIFLVHVEAEVDVLRKMLGVVENRRAELGPRVAARDIENALEDLVSIFEAVLKFITRQHLRRSGRTNEEVEETLRKEVRNSYQSLGRGAPIFEQIVGLALLEGVEREQITWLDSVFEKRHPIAHNLGVLDRQYLDRVRSGELEGREVRVTREEVEGAAALVSTILKAAYQRAFPDGASSPSSPKV